MHLVWFRRDLRLNDNEVVTLATANNQPLLPLGRCHELLYNLSGQLSLDLDHPYRLIFESANEPIPTKPDGGINWTKVTAVMILGVGS